MNLGRRHHESVRRVGIPLTPRVHAHAGTPRVHGRGRPRISLPRDSELRRHLRALPNIPRYPHPEPARTGGGFFIPDHGHTAFRVVGNTLMERSAPVGCARFRIGMIALCLAASAAAQETPRENIRRTGTVSRLRAAPKAPSGGSGCGGRPCARGAPNR